MSNSECSLCEKLANKFSLNNKACIKKVWFFQNLERSDLETLGLHIKKERMSSGQVVFQQGMSVSRMFIIYSGRIRLWKVTENGNEVTLDIRQAGDVLGESMLNDEVIPVNATCLEDTVTCGLTKEGFEQLVLTNPNIGLQVIKNLSQRIDWLTSRIGDMSYSNLGERLYRILLTVAQEHGKKSDQGIMLPIPLTHEDLSFLVGAHRVSITRAMSELQNSGLVLRKGKHLIIRCEVV